MVRWPSTGDEPGEGEQHAGDGLRLHQWGIADAWVHAVTGLMRFVSDRYEREIVPTKAPRPQRDNLDGLSPLRKVFEAVSIDSITPQYTAMYRDRRGKKTPVRANREIALFSHVWHVAREWGFTQKEDPVRGVRKN